MYFVTFGVPYAQSQSAGGEQEKAYLLQRYSMEWQEFVDVVDAIEIGNKDHLKAVPIPAMSPIKVRVIYYSLLKIYIRSSVWWIAINLEGLD